MAVVSALNRGRVVELDREDKYFNISLIFLWHRLCSVGTGAGWMRSGLGTDICIRCGGPPKFYGFSSFLAKREQLCRCTGWWYFPLLSVKERNYVDVMMIQFVHNITSIGTTQPQ